MYTDILYDTLKYKQIIYLLQLITPSYAHAVQPMP